MKPSIGRIVHYSLSETDVQRIDSLPGLPGERNPHHIGQILPLLVCVVWDNECGQDKDGVNGQLFLDGDRSLWITSVCEGTDPGTWSWPVKVGA